jgi:sulfate/thiosulfate-binding protein
MNRTKLIAAFGVWVLVTGWAVASISGARGTGGDTLLHASFDATRGLYRDVNTAFIQHIKEETGRTVAVRQSHGGSGKQARTVGDGMPADVVSLALASDVDALVKGRKLVAEDWRGRLGNRSIPFDSLIVFVVREGNPRDIRGWADLARGSTVVVTPNPKTSGGARWNYLAAWGSALVGSGGDESTARTLVTELFRRAPVLDISARSSGHTFVRRGIGDVLIAWESEAMHLQREFPAQRLEVVYPQVTIVAEPPVAVVDANAAERGTTDLAERYVRFLTTPEAQRLAVLHHFRPTINPASAYESAGVAPPPTPRTFTVDELFGGWSAAHTKHFAAGGEFDKILESLR